MTRKLTPAEIERRRRAILPLRLQDVPIAEIAWETGFTLRQVESCLRLHCPELERECQPPRARTSAATQARYDEPRMANTGKRCHRCRQAIGSGESYRWGGSGWEHERKCSRAKRKQISLAEGRNLAIEALLQAEERRRSEREREADFWADS